MAKNKKSEPVTEPAAWLATRLIVLPDGRELTEGELVDESELAVYEASSLESLQRLGAIVKFEPGDEEPVDPKPPAPPKLAELELAPALLEKLAQFATVEDLVKHGAANNGLGGLGLTDEEIVEVNAALELALEAA